MNATERKLRTLLENGEDAIIIVDDGRRFQDVNRNFCRLAGQSRLELVGKDLKILSHRRLAKVLSESISELAAARECRFNFELRQPDGVTYHLQLFGVPIPDDKSPLYAVYLRDVTPFVQETQAQRRRADHLERMLTDATRRRQSETFDLGGLLNAVGSFALMINRQGEVIEWNLSAQKKLGYDREEALSAGFSERLFAEYETAMLPALQRTVFEKGDILENFDAQVITSEGVRRIIRWNATPVRSGGAIQAALLIGSDITADRELHTLLESNISQLFQAVNRRGRELVHLQERLDYLFKGVHEAIFTADSSGALVAVNLAWLKLFRCRSPEKAIGKHCLTDFAADRSQGAEIWQSIVSRRACYNQPLEMLTLDGAPLTVLLTVTAQPVIGAQGWNYEGFIRDITELKRLENELVVHTLSLERLLAERSAELAASEAKLRRITDNARDLIYQVDIRTMNFTYLSPAAERITGLSAHALSNLGLDGFTRCIHPEDVGRYFENWSAVTRPIMGGETEFDLEYRFIRPDGTICWFSDHGRVTCDEAGNLVTMEGIVRDITEFKRIAAQLERHTELLEQLVAKRTAALSESESRYRLLFAEAGDCIFICDAKGRLVELNERGRELFGQSMDDINRAGFAALLNETSRRRFNRALKDCLERNRKPEPFQIEFINPNGRKLFLEIQSNPLVTSSGERMVLNIARDLTVRRRTIQALSALKEFNEGIVQSMSEGIFIENEDGLCEFVNPAMAGMLNLQPDAMVGRHYREFLPPEETEFVTGQTELRRIKGSARYETRLRSADGKMVPVMISSRNRYSGERLVGSLSVVTDLSQAKESERRQRMMERLLAEERKLADIGILTAGIAHNINNPLTAIGGYIEIMKARYPDCEICDLLLNQAKKIESITRNLMVKARSEQNKNVRPLNLNQLITTELTFLEANLEFKAKVTTTVDLDPNLPAVNGVYSDFTQVISNLIANALDAMHQVEKKQLSIRSAFKNDEIIVAISDNGVGIAPEHLPHIFDAFFSTKPPIGESGESVPSGTGLGLSTARQLVAHYNGRIEVSSQPGKGSTFSIHIPLNPSETPSPPPHAENDHQPQQTIQSPKRGD